MRDRKTLKFVVRDAAIAAITLALWIWLLSSRSGVLLNVSVALMTVVCGYLAHEWGHLFGCWYRGAAVRMPDRVTALFLFNFDVGRNDRRQFNAMAMGGFIASVIYVILLAALMPLDVLAGKLAMILVVLGVIATFVFEVPTAWRVFRGAPLPTQGPAFVSKSD